MNSGELLKVAIEALTPVLLAVVSWLGYQASQLISTKVKNGRAKAVLNRLAEATTTTVSALQQTVVAAMKEKAADGKLTPEEVEELKELALDEIVKHLGGDTGAAKQAKALGLDMEAFESMIETKVEASIADRKMFNLP